MFQTTCLTKALNRVPARFSRRLCRVFLDCVSVAAVEVVDAFDDGFASGDQACHDEAGGGAQVGRHHDYAGEFFHTLTKAVLPSVVMFAPMRLSVRERA